MIAPGQAMRKLMAGSIRVTESIFVEPDRKHTKSWVGTIGAGQTEELETLWDKLTRSMLARP